MARATQSYFAGQWQMVRIIENVPEGVIGEVWGEAVFTPEGDSLICRETGVLRFAGQDWHTGRSSRWRISDDGHVEVFYADGRPFHDFLTEEPIALAIEGDVEYRITYDFGEKTWLCSWEMLGPEGTYRMDTRYRR